MWLNIMGLVSEEIQLQVIGHSGVQKFLNVFNERRMLLSQIDSFSHASECYFMDSPQLQMAWLVRIHLAKKEEVQDIRYITLDNKQVPSIWVEILSRNQLSVLKRM